MSQHTPVNPVLLCAKTRSIATPLYGRGRLFFFRCVATPFNETITSANTSFTVFYN
jgi:hypothetical protein